MILLIGEIYKYIPSKYIIDSLELKAEHKSVLQKNPRLFCCGFFCWSKPR